MHEFFRKAIRPRPRHSCLRVPLLPLTLGHLFLLEELDSPILDRAAEGFGDIILAVFVCAQTHEVARRWVRRGWWIEILARYWGWRCRKLELAGEVEKFAAYLKDEQAGAPVEPIRDGSSRTVNAPWCWVLFEFLRSTYRLTEAEALDMPMRTANALWAVRADMEGRITLATASTGLGALIHDLWRDAHRNGQEVKN